MAHTQSRESVRGEATAAERIPGTLFVLSSPRSGSTLFRAMLARHPGLFCPPELHLLPYDSLGERHERLRVDSLGLGLQHAIMALRRIDFEAASADVADLVRRDMPIPSVYALLKEMAGPRILVDKSPWYAQHPETLARCETLFAEAKYIHLVRHPYAVMESFARRGFERFVEGGGADPMALAEKIWASENANLNDFLDTVPAERHCRVRFEDLVGDPESTLRGVCAFLSLPFDEAMLTPYEGDITSSRGEPGTIGMGDPGFFERTAIEPALGEAWRSASIGRRLGSYARRIAIELGYELPQNVAPPASPANATPPPSQARPAPEKPLDFCVVPVHASGSRTPLFLVSGAGGVTHTFYKLPTLLDPEQPIYAMQDPGLERGREPYEHVEELAAHYVRAIREVQPEGPYRIGGWSFGGTVAYEMAQQLTRAGCDVDRLILFDTYAKDPNAPVRARWLQVLRSYARNFRVGAAMSRYTYPYIRDGIFLIVMQAGRRKNNAHERPRIREYIKWAWADLFRHYFLKQAEVVEVVSQNSRLRMIEMPTIRNCLHVLNINVQSLRRYTPKPFPGRLTVIRASNQPFKRRFHDDLTLGWQGLAQGGVDVHTTPGNHVALFSKPYIDDLAKLLARLLDN